MSTYVARRYKFHASHEAVGMPAPWSERHEHDYTVEVVYGGDGDVVVDTDEIDSAWRVIAPLCEGQFLNDTIGGPTTVESLARLMWSRFSGALVGLSPSRVTVWEDDERWGRYQP